MSNLEPQKRMDVNGRLVTRHVRPAATPVLARSFPVPYLSDHANNSYTAAASIAGFMFTVDDSGELLDSYGNEQHEFTFEEAVDAIDTMFPLAALRAIQEKLKSLPEGRIKHLILEPLYPQIENHCLDKQNEHEVSQLSKRAVNIITDSLELAEFADDFTPSDTDEERILSSMFSSSRSVLKEYENEEWREVLPDEDTRRKLLEAEFIVNFLTGSKIEYERNKIPADTFRHRMSIRENYSRIKEHQAVFRERRIIDVGMLDDLDNTSLAIREGTL